MGSSRHDEDLAGCGFGDARGDAPKHEAAKTSALVGSEDDEVGPLRFRGRQDGLRGLALPDEECRPGPYGASAEDDGLGAPLDTRPFLVDPSEETAARQAKPRRVDDAQHDQVCGAVDGELDSALCRVPGDCRKVGGQDDLGAVCRTRGGHVRAQVDAGRNPFHAPIITKPTSP